MREYLLTFFVAAAVTYLVVGLAGRFAYWVGAVPPTRERDVHRDPVPRLGGLAMFLAFIVPALAFLPLDGPYRGILLGAAIATVVGIADDTRGLRWWAKLTGQFAAAAVAVGLGVSLDRFTFPLLGVHDLPVWVAWAVSITWIVALMNMVNFVDGMDGLAAGICGIRTDGDAPVSGTPPRTTLNYSRNFLHLSSGPRHAHPLSTGIGPPAHGRKVLTGGEPAPGTGRSDGSACSRLRWFRRRRRSRRRCRRPPACARRR